MFKKVIVATIASTALVLVDFQLASGVLALLNVPNDFVFSAGIAMFPFVVFVNWYPVSWIVGYVTKESPHEKRP